MLCTARLQQFATRAGQAARFACAGLLAVAPRSLAANDAAAPDNSTQLLSTLLADAAKRQVATVLIGVDRCRVSLVGGGTYDVPLLHGIDLTWLADRLGNYGVAFGALVTRPTTADRLKPVVAAVWRLAQPFACVYFMHWLWKKWSQGADESVATQFRKKPSRTPKGFERVAGVDEALRELREVVACLRDPAAFARIGARCPRGILLTGPSGTGKTLLARCVAEEADCEFLSCSGSAFVELFVGRGSARVRNLFAKARSLAPCVVFIDEIDAIAKARGMLSHNDEREQTLNQILCELDGFEAKDDDAATAPLVVLLAATNRPEILDDALVRPGRLDRCVVVPLPDEAGRRAILGVHAARVRLAPGVSLERVAARADGFSGADLANVVNEGALLAVRGSADAVTTGHLLDAVAKAQEAKRATRRRGFETLVPEAD